MAFLEQLGDIYWHANFYYQFFELAASGAQPPAHTPTSDAIKGDSLTAFFNSRVPGRQLKNTQSGRDKYNDRTRRAAVHTGSDHGPRADIHDPGHEGHDSRLPGIRGTSSPDQDQLPELTEEQAMTSERVGAAPDPEGGIPSTDPDEWDFGNWLEDYPSFLNLFPSA